VVNLIDTHCGDLVRDICSLVARQHISGLEQKMHHVKRHQQYLSFRHLQLLTFHEALKYLLT